MPVYNFGNGIVAAHRHRNPNGRLGGWVADTARVDSSVYVGNSATVHDHATIRGDARIMGNARIYGNAVVRNATVRGDAGVGGEARVDGAEVIITGGALVNGNANISGESYIAGGATITGSYRAVDERLTHGYHERNNSNSVDVTDRSGTVNSTRRNRRAVTAATNQTSTRGTSDMARKFGIEIELIGLPGTENSLRDAMRSAGIRIQARDEYYQAAPPEGMWNIHGDGSLSSGGFELVSPILEGEAGIEEVRKVARLVVEAGGRVDATCGLHVHVDVRDLSTASIVNVAARYHRFEGEINNFMPTGRRNGRWCRGMSDVVTPERISTFLNRGNQEFGCLDRYRALNLSAFARHGTVEFRQHNGTVNAEKMDNWIRFCVGFVEASIVTAPLPEPIMPPGRRIPRQVTITMADGSTAQVDAPTRGNPNLRKLARLHTRLLNLGVVGRNPEIGPVSPRREGRPVSIELATLADEFGWNVGTLRANFRHLRELYGRVVRIEDAEGRALRGENRMNGTHCSLSPRRVFTATQERIRREGPAPEPRRTLPATPSDSLFRGIPLPVVTYLNERALEFSGHVSSY